MTGSIQLTKTNEMRSPENVMDRIIDKLNNKCGKPPFLIISSAREINGPNVMPSLWRNYFFKNSFEEHSYLYDGVFNTINEIKAVAQASPNIVAIVNRTPDKMSKRVGHLREALPFSLSSNSSILPYDPANGMELEAILNMALRNEEPKKIIYLSSHNTGTTTPEPNVPVDKKDIVKGMYLYKTTVHKTSSARIIASGRSLLTALKIFNWLEKELNIPVDLWSCPSYTRLSREMDNSYEEELFNIKGSSPTHVDYCLKGDIPTIAMTPYNSLICEQISNFFRGNLMPIGNVGSERNSMASSHKEVAGRCIHHLFKHNVISSSEFKLARHNLLKSLH